MSKVLRKNTENEKDTILGIRNDSIWKYGMGMTTAFTDDPSNTDILIDRFSMDDIYDRSGVESVNLTVSFGMTDGTFHSLGLKRAHEIKK